MIVESWKESLERKGKGKGREKGEMRNWKERKGRERERKGEKMGLLYYNILKHL